MRKMEIGEHVVMRSIDELLSGAKKPEGRRYLLQALGQQIDLEGFMLVAIVKVSARKYCINEVITEEDSVVLDDNEIILTADWYNIKQFNHIEDVTYYNDLLGESTEPRIAKVS